MIKNILVGTDGSAYSVTACRYAIDLSQRLQARLLALHVIDARALEGPLLADVSNWVGAQPYGGQRYSFHKMMEERGRNILDAFEKEAIEKGVKPEKIMTVGHPVSAILREEGRAELLIVGRKGEHAEWSEGMVGSSVDRLVRRSQSPCMVTPAEFRPVKRILAAYDGSGHSGRALQTAVGLAQSLPAELTVLTVGKDDSESQAIRDEARKRLAAYGMNISPILREGNPERGILAEAADREADLIVAGTHGHGRIRERILGGITHYMLTHADIALLMVR